MIRKELFASEQHLKNFMELVEESAKSHFDITRNNKLMGFSYFISYMFDDFKDYVIPERNMFVLDKIYLKDADEYVNIKRDIAFNLMEVSINRLFNNVDKSISEENLKEHVAKYHLKTEEEQEVLYNAFRLSLRQINVDDSSDD